VSRSVEAQRRRAEQRGVSQALRPWAWTGQMSRLCIRRSPTAWAVGPAWWLA